MKGGKKEMKSNYWLIGLVVLIVIIGTAYFLVPNEMEDMTNQESMEEESQNTYMDVSAQEAKALIDENPEIIIIDVSPHYDNGHIPNAINYYPSSALEEAIPNLDKEATYLVYCHADGPSRAGAQKLVDAGLIVYRLESHYSGWVEAGYEVEV